MPNFNWVFEYKPIASEILAQPSRYTKCRKQFASRRKRSTSVGPGHSSILTYLLFSLTFSMHFKICAWIYLDFWMAPVTTWMDGGFIKMFHYFIYAV